MLPFWIILSITVFAVSIFFLMCFICFYITFYNPEKVKISKSAYAIPNNKTYAPYRDKMLVWQKEMEETEYENVTAKSFDGLTLCAKYYEVNKGAPIELMMHGYRGNAKRDLCGGITRAFAVGHNVLLIDQRASGNSEGHVITFGINESKDALVWLDYLERRFGSDVKIILTGVSMGASTALMCIERGLPKCVKGILADCGFSSVKDIIMYVGKKKYPMKLMYPFVKMGAKIFGKFDPEEISPRDAVKKSPVPIFFAHGDADTYVPCYMSEENYNACTSHKKLVIIEGAGHVLCYPAAPDKYIKEVTDFFAYLKD